MQLWELDTAIWYMLHFFHVQPVTFQTLFTQHFHPTALFINNCTQTLDTDIQPSLLSGIGLLTQL